MARPGRSRKRLRVIRIERAKPFKSEQIPQQLQPVEAVEVRKGTDSGKKRSRLRGEAAAPVRILLRLLPPGERHALEELPRRFRPFRRQRPVPAGGGVLAEGDDLAGYEFLAVARLEGGAGRDPAIRLAAPVEEAALVSLFKERLREVDAVEFDPERERVYARRELRLGAVVLRSTMQENPPEPPQSR